ncbi:MAG: hypothetical protein IVW36_10960 [Dehalococcoidia bacterium]|nr:hypothetical protein [Dehalococcoidia bacterium]
MYVTPEACEALSELLARRAQPERCLRLSTVQGNYRFVLDEAIEQDVSFEHAGRVVLVVSETVSRDLWGITVDCDETAGKRKLIFRKAKGDEPFDTTKEEPDPVPPGWKAQEHERLLAEIAEIGRQIAALRGGSKAMLRDQLQTLELAKQAKWDAIRALWAGDGGWHRRQAALAAEAE